MSADIFELISFIAFTFAAVFALGAIILYFKLNVRAILDDLSGKKAERQIRAYREKNTVAKRRVNLVSEQRDYYYQKTPIGAENTERLEKTEVLPWEETVVLDTTTVIEPKPDNGNTILFEEMVVHTEEEI